MKQKIITIIVTLIAILAPILTQPAFVHYDYNILKMWVLVIGGALLLVLLLASYKTLTIDKKDILILIFLGLIIISTIFSSSLRISIFGDLQRDEGVLVLITYILLYLCSKKYFKLKKYKVLLNIIFFTCMLIGALGIAQKYVSFKKLFPIFNKGICSTFGNSNFFGSFITMVLPISISIFIFKGNKRSFILSLVMFFNMISSGTRSAWGAFIVGSVFFLILLIKQKNKKYFVRTGILLVCFIIIFMYLFSNFNFIKTKINPQKQEEQAASVTTTEAKLKTSSKEVKQAVKTKDFSNMGSGRIAIWNMTLKVILSKPFLGCGPDNLNDGLHTYSKKEVENYIKTKGVDVDKAHNEYLQIAATIGLPALIIYLIFLSLIVFPKMKYMFKNKLLFILCTTIICYLAQAFFNISTIGVAPLFWIILGISDNKEMLDILKIE